MHGQMKSPHGGHYEIAIWLSGKIILCIFLPKLDKHFVQSLKKYIHLSPAHAYCSSHSEVGSGVAVMMGAPIGEHM